MKFYHLVHYLITGPTREPLRETDLKGNVRETKIITAF